VPNDFRFNVRNRLEYPIFGAAVLNLRILLHYDQIRNAGKVGWARYVVLLSLSFLLLVFLMAMHYWQALLLLPFAVGVLQRDWRTHIWLCFILLFYFLLNIDQLAAAPDALAYAEGFLIATLFTAAMLYCRWSKQIPPKQEAP
jgi:hypothetical protein